MHLWLNPSLDRKEVTLSAYNTNVNGSIISSAVYILVSRGQTLSALPLIDYKRRATSIYSTTGSTIDPLQTEHEQQYAITTKLLLLHFARANV